MIVRGKDIFNIVYFSNVIFQSMYIFYHLTNNHGISLTYYVVAGLSIISTTLIKICIK